MSNSPTKDLWAENRARRIAQKALAGEYDILLACRDLSEFRGRLPISAEDMDVFVGVASEVDGLPIGPEREHWQPEALKMQDAKAEEYRQQIMAVVNEALQSLLAALGDDQELSN
jgi:hypothetical protein